jgi:hypothetical protein
VAKGKRVKGIHVKAPLRENARRILAFRLDEVLFWRHSLTDPAALTDLHNLRIAAKRLRYALESFEICFPGSKRILGKLTALQEAVGDIHDVDVLIDILRSRLRVVDAAAEQAAVQVMRSEGSAGEQSNRLRHVLYAQARDRQRLGLFGLLGGYTVEREKLYQDLQSAWGGEALDRFAAALLEAIGMSPNVLAAEPDGADSDDERAFEREGEASQPATNDDGIRADTSQGEAPSSVADHDGSLAEQVP